MATRQLSSGLQTLHSRIVTQCFGTNAVDIRNRRIISPRDEGRMTIKSIVSTAPTVILYLRHIVQSQSTSDVRL